MAGTLEYQIDPPCWALTPVALDALLRNVSEISSGEAVFRLVSGGHPDVEGFMATLPARYPNEPTKKFLWFLKTPGVFYTPATSENLHRLADLSINNAEPEFGDEIQIYLDDQLILSWHDLPDDPVYVSTVVPESSISKFCRLVGCTYSRKG